MEEGTVPAPMVGVEAGSAGCNSALTCERISSSSSGSESPRSGWLDTSGADVADRWDGLVLVAVVLATVDERAERRTAVVGRRLDFDLGIVGDDQNRLRATLRARSRNAHTADP